MSTAEDLRAQHRAYLLKLDRLETKLSHYVEASLIEKDYTELLELDPSTKTYEKNSTKFSSRVSTYISKTFNPFVPDPALKRCETGWLLRIFKNSYFIARTFRLHTQVPNALEKHLK